MNLPNLPTDNLYKFISILGIVVIVLSGYYYFVSIEEIVTKLNALSVAEKKSDLLIPRINASINNQNELSKTLQNTVKENLGILTVDKLEEMFKEINDEVNKHTDLVEALKLAQIDHYAAETIIARDIRQFKTYKGQALVIILFGLLISAAGFGLWYEKVQKYQDAILKNNSINQNK